MAYTASILFDFVSTSVDNGKIVASITDSLPTVTDKNVFYEIIGPAGLIVRSADFNAPDGVLNTVTPTASMPLVTVPIDSLSQWLEGTYKLNFYIKDTTLPIPPDYDEVHTCEFVLDIKKQGASNCNIQGNIKVDINCHCALMHVEELTDYQGSTIISHELTIIQPTIPGQATPLPLVTVGYTYDLVFTHSNVSYTFNIETVYENYYCDNQVTVREDLLATYTEKVVCDRNLCALMKCLRDKLNALKSKMAALGGWDAVPKYIRDEYYLLQMNYFMYQGFVNCGDWQSADDYFDELKRLLHCECGCSNGNAGQPIPVIPECGSGSITSLTPSSPQVTITNPSPGVWAIGLATSFIQAATRGMAGTSPIIVGFNAGTNTWEVSLDPAFVAAATAGGLTNVTTATPTYLAITTPSTGVRNINFDPAPLLATLGYGSWVIFDNADANSVFGAIDFDNTPYPLKYSLNTAFLKEMRIQGTFKYNGYNPGSAMCILIASVLSLPIGANIGQSIPCFDAYGEIVGALRMYGNGTNSNLIFVHNTNYVQNSDIFVTGRYYLD